LGDKFFCADDARIGKVFCTVPETIDRVYFEIFPSFFLNCLFSYYRKGTVLTDWLGVLRC
jgi:hypothetical protein